MKTQSENCGKLQGINNLVSSIIKLYGKKMEGESIKELIPIAIREL